MPSEPREIREACRCGGSTVLVGSMATDERLVNWRLTHRCLAPDEQRFGDPAGVEREGGTTQLGFNVGGVEPPYRPDIS